jgi:hypothetical protein
MNLKRVRDRVLGALRRRSDTERLIPALIRIPLCFKRLIEIRTHVPGDAAGRLLAGFLSASIAYAKRVWD